jgi:hypothetical protein
VQLPQLDEPSNQDLGFPTGDFGDDSDERTRCQAQLRRGRQLRRPRVRDSKRKASGAHPRPVSSAALRDWAGRLRATGADGPKRGKRCRAIEASEQIPPDSRTCGCPTRFPVRVCSIPGGREPPFRRSRLRARQSREERAPQLRASPHYKCPTERHECQDVGGRRLPRYRGHASARRSRVSARCSGSTFTSASTGMKFVSPAQRGTTCWCTWSTIPAPAMRPRFQPRL